MIYQPSDAPAQALQEALSRRYGSAPRYILSLSTGQYAVIHPYMRQLVAVCDTIEECFQVEDIPPPRKQPPSIATLDIKVNL